MIVLHEFFYFCPLSRLKDFLPKEYVKAKSIEKKIFIEHKQLYSLSEVEAKVRYTQLARSLKTYGITFFLVKVNHTSLSSMLQLINKL